MLAKCIDDEDADGYLVHGEVYDVEYFGLSYFETNDGRTWCRERFEIIEENT